MRSKKTGIVIGVFTAMNAAGIGVALFLQCGFGGDSIAVLCQGIQSTCHISFGNASVLFNLILIGIALGLAKENLGLGTAAYALVSGYFIDFYSFVLRELNFAEIPYIVKWMSYFVGILLLATALAILIAMRCGMNAVDAVLYAVEKKWRIPYQILRTIFDISAVVIGFLLGGTVGWGTLACALCTGTFVRKIVAYLSSVLNSISAESK